MEYRYIAYTGNQLVKGSVVAGGEEEAAAIIDHQGLALLKLEAASSLGDWKQYFRSKPKVLPDDIIVFSRQLKLLTEAGIDIVTSLDLLREQITNRTFRETLDQVISDIRSGSRVADAFSKHPQVFPAIYCRSIGVGEQTGEIGMMLDQIAGYMEGESTKKKGLKGALMYPMVVTGVAIAVGMLMTVFVMPTLQGLYTTLHAKVPAITQMLLTVGNLVRGNVLPILGTVAAIVIGANLYFRSEAGKLQKDRWALTLPMAGMINRLKELSYCCRTMAVLFKSGLTSTEVMDIVADSSNNRLMKQALVEVKQGMLKGEGIARPMADNKLFLPMMVQMVKVGEETGGLGDSLVVVADTYDADAAAKTKRFVRTISTALTILITIMVGTIVMAMMMAMYGIYGQVKLG